MHSDVAAFLEQNADLVCGAWLGKIRAELPPGSPLTDDQLRDSLALFLRELGTGLRLGAGRLAREGKSSIAREHGGQRQFLELDLITVVREYRLLLESVSEAAVERGVPLSAQGLLDLSSALFAAAADAVEEFVRKKDEQERRAEFEHAAFVAHELRNPLASARTAWDLTLRKGALEPLRSGTLTRSLARLATLIDESITRSRLGALSGTVPSRRERVDLDGLVADVRADSLVDADAKQVRVETPPSGLSVEVEPRLLRSALSNLLRNAVKFTRQGGAVAVRSRVSEGRVLIEVEDECGGLPSESAERLFQAFTQASPDRSGFGLGLAITKQAVEANGGTIRVSDKPGQGCMFTIDLPGPV